MGSGGSRIFQIDFESNGEDAILNEAVLQLETPMIIGLDDCLTVLIHAITLAAFQR